MSVAVIAVHDFHAIVPVGKPPAAAGVSHALRQLTLSSVHEIDCLLVMSVFIAYAIYIKYNNLVER